MLAAHRQPLVPDLDEILGDGGNVSDGSARRLKVNVPGSSSKVGGNPCVTLLALPGGEVMHSKSGRGLILSVVRVRDDAVGETPGVISRLHAEGSYLSSLSSLWR